MSGKPSNSEHKDQNIFSFLSSLGSGIVDPVSNFLNLNQDNGKKDDKNTTLADLFCCLRGHESEQKNSVEHDVDGPSIPNKVHSPIHNSKLNDLFSMLRQAKHKFDEDLEWLFRPVLGIADHFCCRRREGEKKKSDVSFVKEVDDKRTPTGNGNRPSGSRSKFFRPDEDDWLGPRQTFQPMAPTPLRRGFGEPTATEPRRTALPPPPRGRRPEEMPLSPAPAAPPPPAPAAPPPPAPPPAPPPSTVSQPKPVKAIKGSLLYGNRWRYEPLKDQNEDLKNAVEEFKETPEYESYQDKFKHFNSEKKDLIIYQYAYAKGSIDEFDKNKKFSDEQVKSLKEYHYTKASSGKNIKDFLDERLEKIDGHLILSKMSIDPAKIEDKIFRLNKIINMINGNKDSTRAPKYCGYSCFSFSSSSKSSSR